MNHITITKTGITNKKLILILILISLLSLLNVSSQSEPVNGCCITQTECVYQSSDLTCYGTFLQETPCQLVCPTGCCVCYGQGQNICKIQTSKPEGACEQKCSGLGLNGYFYKEITNEDQCSAVCPSIGPASLSGTVKDLDGSSLSGAEVKIGELTDSTLADGSYSFTSLPSGTIQITASNPNYITKTETITLLPNQASIKDITLSPAGQITGKVTDIAGVAIPGAVVTATGPTTKQANTDSSGNYVLTDLPIGTYTLTASKLNYLSPPSQTAQLTSANPTSTINFVMALQETGTLIVIVKDIQTNLFIENAEIRINDQTKGFTAQNGQFVIQLNAGTYTLKALKFGYQPTTVPNVNIIKDQTTTKNIALQPTAEVQCAYPNKQPVTQLTASHISGQKALRLEWQPPDCTNIAGYSIYRSANNQNFVSLTFLQAYSIGETFYNPTSYIDNSVEWSTAYQYFIAVYYSDFPSRTSISVYSNTITTGNALCENKYQQNSFTEFCQNTYLRKTCNNENQLIDASEDNYPADCATISDPLTGTTYLCAGPDSAGNTICKNQGNCNVLTQQATPLGMYYAIDSCNGADNENYCYYDYSQTTIDKCYSCSPQMTCFNYNSEQACETDNCIASANEACSWQPTAYSSLGKGFCYQENYKGTDYCSLCSPTNLFENTGCTSEICNNLGACYSSQDQTQCNACDSNTACESFKSELECTSNQPISITKCSNAPISITPSNDACSLGTCKWNSASQKCYKDANDDAISDCEAFSSSIKTLCKKDNNAPITTPPYGYIALNRSSQLTFTIDDAQTFTYCIDSTNTCCPSIEKTIPADNTLIFSTEELNNAFNIEESKDYFIRFFSADRFSNVEQLKNITFYADIIPPTINIDPSILENVTGTYPLKSNLTITISISEPSNCTDRLRKLGDTSSSTKLFSQIGTGWSLTYPLLEDSVYEYTVSCHDNLNNFAERTLLIDIDADKLIRIISPSGPTNKTSIVFNITTQDPAICSLINKNTQTEQPFASDSYNHWLTINNLQANKHYDYYEAKCARLIESSKTDQKQFYFTIDQLPPITLIKLTAENEVTTAASGWEYYFVKPVNVTFMCIDELKASFGCNQTKYYIADTDAACTPSAVASWSSVAATITQDKKICYSSFDNGNNQEVTKSGIIHILNFNINFIAPPYGASPTSIFDVIIDTTIPVDECKFNTYNFNYDDVTSSAYIFTKLSPTTFKITGFPSAIRNGAGLEPDEIFPMHIKCRTENNQILGQLVSLKYDHTPPIITDAYATKDLAIRNSTVTDRNSQEIWFVVKTDDPSVCKYDKETEVFDSMQFKFPGFEQHNFTTEHYHKLQLTDADDDQIHTYKISCMNEAEYISQTAEIQFIVDYDAEGMVMLTLPPNNSKTKEYPSVTLEAITTKEADCDHTKIFGNVEQPYNHFTTTGAFNHSSNLNIPEGAHTYKASCFFHSTGNTAFAITSFTVDRTHPTTNSIILGSRYCSLTEPIFIQIDATDTYSQVTSFAYRIKNKTNGIIQNGTFSDNPYYLPINSTLQNNSKYTIEIRSIDELGNEETAWKPSSQFNVSPGSFECTNDINPPIVTINKTTLQTKVKVDIFCDDLETACASIKYGISSSSALCNASRAYSGSLNFTNQSYLCYNATDLKWNEVLGTELIEIPDIDHDGILDPFDQCPTTPGTIIYSGCNNSIPLITLIHPQYGSSNQPNFTLEIESAYPSSECRFAATQAGAVFNNLNYPENRFIPNATNPRRHTFYNFPTLSFLGRPFEPEESLQIWIVCNTTLPEINITAPYPVTLTYDPYPPSILSINLSPILVISKYDVVTLKVETDDSTICKYGSQNIPFEQMQNSFPGSFAQTHQTVIHEDFQDKTAYTYTVICMNTAEDLSQPASASLSVDFSQGGSMQFLNQNSIFNTTHVFINLITNKFAECYYENTKFQNTGYKQHTAFATAALQEGEGSIPIKCIFADNAQQLSDTFSYILDLTPPTVTSIEDYNYSCSLTNFTADLTAHDRFSPVTAYKYEVRSQSGSLLKEGSSNSPHLEISGLNLANNQQYFVKAKAQDSMGWWSNFNTSNGFIAVPSTSPLAQCVTDETAPTTRITLTSTEKQETTTSTNWHYDFLSDVSVQFNCSDQVPGFGCDNTTYCLAGPSASTCTPSTLYSSVFTLDEPKRICYHSEDKGNNLESAKCGIIDAKSFKLTLLHPKYGVSDTPVFDLLLETSYPAYECKFSSMNVNKNQYHTTLIYPNSNFTALNAERKQHIFYNFPQDSYIQSEFDGIKTMDIYVYCNTTLPEINVSGPHHMTLSYDPTAPTIMSVALQPNYVISPSDVITLSAQTDDPTICKYDTQNASFEAMRYNFTGFQEKTFETTHAETIYAYTLNNNQQYNYTVICVNGAENLSQPAAAGLFVNFSAGGLILSTSPSGILNYTSVQLAVETDKQAACTFFHNSATYNFNTQNNKNHYYNIQLQQGIYNIPVTCLLETAKTVQATISFIIDQSPPIINSVDDGNYSCSLEEVSVFVSASDSLSSVDRYDYYLMDGNTVIKTESSSSASVTIDDLNLTNGKTYTVKVRAKDQAGFWSNFNTSNGFTAVPENNTHCEDINDRPPTITLSKKAKRSGIEVEIKCTDDKSSCKNVSYGLSPISTCIQNASYSGPFLLSKTSWVCYKAYDSLNHVSSGIEKVEVKDADNDGVIDESDDCPNTPSGSGVDENGCAPSQRDTDHDGITDNLDRCPTTPPDEIDNIITDRNSDMYGCTESEPRDLDRDGVYDAQDKCPNTPLGEAVDSDGCSDSQKDSDNDGLDDAWEKRYFGCATCADPNKDDDGDGLTNKDEYKYKTDPKKKDTDGDGYDDKTEIEKGTDPLNPLSYPKSKVIPITILIFGIIFFLAGAGYLLYLFIAAPPAPPKPQIPIAPRAPTMPPAQSASDLAARKAALERFRKLAAQRAERRQKAFDIFASGKPAEKPSEKPALSAQKPSPESVKVIEKPATFQPLPVKELKPIAKAITVPKQKTAFEKLARLTEAHITQKKKKPSAELSKMLKIHPAEKDVFEKLTDFIGKRIIPEKEIPKDLTKEQKEEIRKIFYNLSKLSEEEKSKKLRYEQSKK